jgi:hypothetical protein
MMVVGVAGLGEVSEHPADLAGAEADQLAVMIMQLDWPGKLSTGGGAPFERR